jgi:hypothetical protein
MHGELEAEATHDVSPYKQISGIRPCGHPAGMVLSYQRFEQFWCLLTLQILNS